MKFIIVFVLSACIAVCGLAQPKLNYQVASKFHVGGTGGWDYISTHKNKIYIAHGSVINILDEKTGDSVGMIVGKGAHGIAFNDDLNTGYISNGRGNNVTVFDVATNKILDSIATDKNPDAIMYEPFTKTIVTCNGGSHTVSFIDPVTKKVINTIDVGGKPETAVTDGKGKMFVNIEDKNEIVAIDLRKKTITNHFSLQGAEGPTGLAFDAQTRRLFAGCEKKLVILNSDNGKVISTITIGDGCDGVAFSDSKKLIFTSNGADGTMSVIKEESPDKFSLVNNVSTKKGARTITIDEATGDLYLPASDFEPNTVTGARAVQTPGTFEVLVVKNQ